MNKARLSIIIISLFYFFGIIGLAVPPVRNLFAMCTPLTLILSLGFVLYNHERWSSGLMVVLTFCGVVGYFSEVAGVQTGLIFGEYEYGHTLGLQVFDVPVVLAVNWLLLIYTSAVAINRFFPKIHWSVRAALSAALMVALDVLIEPIAIKLDFWSWANGTIPLQNFVGWFVIALFLQLIFFGFLEVRERQKPLQNKIGVFLFGWQIVFFGVLNFIL